MPQNYAKSQQPVFLFTGNIRKRPVYFSLLPMHEAMDHEQLGLLTETLSHKTTDLVISYNRIVHNAHQNCNLLSAIFNYFCSQ